MVFPPPEWPGHLIGGERATGADKIPLRGDAAAVVVVGTSTVRGLDGRTHTCLAEIAASESRVNSNNNVTEGPDLSTVIHGV